MVGWLMVLALFVGLLKAAAYVVWHASLTGQIFLGVTAALVVCSWWQNRHV